MISLKAKFRILDGFDDPSMTADIWNGLLSRGQSDGVFMSWHWQKAWWKAFGRGKLILVVAEQDGEPIAIAPLFADHGIVYLVGSGGSDYLDMIGDVSDLDLLEGLLQQAKDSAPNFTGFCFYHVLETSAFLTKIQEIAIHQGWQLSEEGTMPAPFLGLKDNPELAYEATRKKSLLRHEAYFNRNGGITVEHLTESSVILPHLESFFEQHIVRWAPTPYPSLFLDPRQRQFYQELTASASESKYVRFTRILWQGRMIACHFGVNYRGSFLWYKPCFDIELSKNSPGEVLLRQLLLRAQAEAAHTFDFGLGDEFFKTRYATGTRHVYSRGLHPASSIKKADQQ